MLVVLLFVSIAASFYGGWRLHAIRTIDYRQRWQEALALLKEERMAVLPSSIRDQCGPADAQLALDLVHHSAMQKLKKAKKSAPTADTLLQLHRLSGKQRYDVEGERLRQNLDPIDDLHGLDPTYTSIMLQRRARHGIG